MSSALAKILTGDFLDKAEYAPHNMAKIRLFYGVPPAPIAGLNSIFAVHDNQQTTLKMGLTGDGRFIPNKNQSGTIEFTLLDGVASNGFIQLALLTGIPYPMYITDTQSAGTSFVIADACTRVGTPEWRKELAVGMQVYTFKAKKLIISTGIKQIL